MNSFLRADGETVLLHLKVQPRSSRNEIGEVLGNELKIKLTAPPVDSAANDALIELLADLLKLPRSRVQLVRGATSRHKVIALQGVTTERVLTALQR